MTELDREEKELLEAYEAGKLKRSKGAAQIRKRHKAYAKFIGTHEQYDSIDAETVQHEHSSDSN